jgi:integral membrane protein (TIGR01906 family)
MKIKNIVLWMVSILIPFFLIISSVRILLNPWYLSYEYSRKDFPVDDYGFTFEDRLHWGNISLEYLVNSSDVTFLSNQNLDNGSPLYNSRELKHMVDVKSIVQVFIIIWYFLAVMLIASLLWFWRKKEFLHYIKALARGGWITLGLISAILIYLLINFDSLFTEFHRIFFEGDTWLFQTSDNLIRLFPLPLWQDAFIFIGVFSSMMALALGIAGILVTHKKKKEAAV